MPLWIAVVGLPLITALQRFSVAYGYAGADRVDAFREAVRVGAVVAVLEAVVGLAHLA